MLPFLSSLLDDGRAHELQPLLPSFIHSTDCDPNNLADILRQRAPVPVAARQLSSPSKSSPHAPGIERSSLSRVVFSDALPPHVLQAVQPLFSASQSGAAAPDFMACLGAALRHAPSPTRFYFIVYFDAQSAIDVATDNIALSSPSVLAVACYWITSAFDMARYHAARCFHENHVRVSFSPKMSGTVEWASCPGFGCLVLTLCLSTSHSFKFHFWSR
jgi:hypothetical protein